MKEQRRFTVVGYKPAYNKQVNGFMRLLDIGTEGMFTPFSEVLTITVAPDCTPEKYAQHADSIKRAYEYVGCHSIRVAEIEQEHAA